MTIWVAGARGMLGQAWGDLLDQADCPWLGTDQELDISDAERVSRFVGEHQIGAVVNCAAYTQVDRAESEPEAALRANVLGPEVLGQVAAGRGIDLLHVSTDYVFDGKGDHPYDEDDPCSPINVYGATKREGEVRLLATVAQTKPERRVYVMRTSWLFGDTGTHFVTTMLKLMAERPLLQVVADQVGRPTYARDLARAGASLLGVADLGIASSPRPPSGIVHFANEGQTSWHGFAVQIAAAARELGYPVLTETIEPVATDAFPRPAPRPAYSVLDTSRFASWVGRAPRPWQEALEACLLRLGRPEQTP